MDTSDVSGMTLDTAATLADGGHVDETGLEIFRWRLDQFAQLGFEARDAVELTTSPAELAQARKLIRAGCPLPTALRILR